ncbi:MAG: endolytic transglycosylase MltG [bacterium]|nr:endolytic transglycosylase MltG [bacterium]
MSKLKWILIAIGIILVMSFYPFLKASYVGSVRPGALVTLTIPDNTDVSGVIDRLADTKLIASKNGYRWYARLDERARRPVSGVYHLSSGLSYRTLVRVLAAGPIREEAQLTIIEGWTVDQEAELIAKQGISSTRIKDEIGKSVDKAPFALHWRGTFSFLRNLSANRSLEGYLFPDTYRVWKDALPEALIEKQLQEFNDRFGKQTVTKASAPLTTLDGVVILASIVEKEVKTDVDRKIVAGIFLNRLNIKMALQSDATLTYAIGAGSRATTEELASKSPYNTYKNRDLPPGPICNPSASSINAVLHPTETDYIYFLTDKSGKVLYAKTFEQHQKNRQQAGY